MHDSSCFLTLTYNDENLPKNGSVDPREITLFLKRLRRNINGGIRYFAVGEYGDRSWRPHYHMALFGTIDQLAIEVAWQDRGFVSLGELNSKSAGYITGYVTKGLTNKKMAVLVDKNLHPEFMRSSKGFKKDPVHPGGLGIAAIISMAQTIKNNKYAKQEAIRTLRHGKMELPLGRYLTQKLMELSGIDPAIYESDFHDYQDEVFDKNLLDDGYSFKRNLFDEHRVQRDVKEHNEKMFPKRRVL